jgi:hypothetical protein
MPNVGDSVYIKQKFREYEANRQNNEGDSDGESVNFPAKAKVIGYLVEFQPSDFENARLKYLTNMKTKAREKAGVKYALVHSGNPIPRFQIDPVSYKIVESPKTMSGGKKTRRRARGRKGTRKAY